MSDLYVPLDGAGDSDLSPSTYSTLSGATVTAHNMQWRPRSAPKNISRAPSPFLGFWNRIGHHQHDDQLLRKTKDVDAYSNYTEKTYSVEGSVVDIHASHHDLATLPARSPSGTPNGSRDGKEPTGGAENVGPPPLTREEFEALPLAIQRKYFSTLERLRFAQGSTDVEGIFNHYDDITSHKTKRRKHGPKRSVPDPYTCRESLATTGSSDDSLFPGIPEKSKNTRLTREEQCELVKQLRASVILDAADEAIYNVRHKTSNKNLAPTSDIDWSTPTLAPRRGSLDSMSATMIRSEPIGKGDPARESLYESFRWLDEEEDLDLRLFLDDYHANLREELPNTGKNTKQPSFRRHLSISKLPFGRSSFSNRPDATGRESPAPNLNLTQQPQTEHFRRRSRTLSLRERRRHAQSGSLSAIDPSAAHYQDPEARLKLRVYLASPQKFDEAIEFGFPATDAVDTPPTVEYRRSVLRKRQSRQNLNDDAGAMRTFLDDDGVDEGDELDDDDDDDDASSISDLDSPKTPQLGGLTPPPGNYRPGRVSTEPLHPLSVSSRGIRPQPSVSDSLYAAIPASSREMTLRMTLTRPDLRADEDLIYGWQQQQQQQHMQAQGQSQHQQAGHAASGSGRKSPSSGNALREDGAGGGAGQGPAMYLGPGQGQGRPHKESFEAILTGNHDQYGPDGAGGDKNFMKRIFNRVRRA